MRYIVLMVIILLSSCAESITVPTSDGTINSGIPVYKKDDVVYCCEIIDDIYNIIAQDNEKKTLTKLEPHSRVTTLFVDDDYLYYTSVISNTVTLLRLKLESGETEELLKHESANFLQNDYIYVVGDTVYYFLPNEGLWSIEGSNTELIAESAVDCVITDNMIYYSKDGNIYSQSLVTEECNILITKDAIFKSGQNDELLLQTLGDGYVDNMLLYNNKLYFLVTDGYSGGIFCTDMEGKDLTAVDLEYRVYRLMFDKNGDMYVSGVNLNTQNKGIYRVSENSELISDEVPVGFYVNDGCYFYTNGKGDLSHID